MIQKLDPKGAIRCGLWSLSFPGQVFRFSWIQEFGHHLAELVSRTTFVFVLAVCLLPVDLKGKLYIQRQPT